MGTFYAGLAFSSGCRSFPANSACQPPSRRSIGTSTRCCIATCRNNHRDPADRHSQLDRSASTPGQAFGVAGRGLDRRACRNRFSAVIGPLAAGSIDILFLLLLVFATTREVVIGRNWRNLPPVVIVLALLSGNVIFHLEDYATGHAGYGTRLGIAAAVTLISLIGGRVIPSFTRNWLVRENPGRLPAPFGRFDLLALAVSLLALVLWVFVPAWPGTAGLMLAAAAGQTARLARWAGDRTFRDRLVLVLHVGYAFVPLGFVILAGAILFPNSVPISAGFMLGPWGPSGQ